MNESLFTRSQGIQLFFIRKILDEDHTMATFFADERIHDFFRQWSQIVRDSKDDEDFPLTINVPADFLKHTDEPVEKEVDLIVLGEEITKRYTPTESKLDAVPKPYHPLLERPKVRPILSTSQGRQPQPTHADRIPHRYHWHTGSYRILTR